jgi:hypothetical protein
MSGSYRSSEGAELAGTKSKPQTEVDEQADVEEPLPDIPDIHPVPDDGDTSDEPAAPSLSFDGVVIGELDSSDLLPKLHALGKHLGAEVLVLSHGRGHGPAGIENINEIVYQQMKRVVRDVRGKDVVLVLDSPGGQADAAYRISRLLQRSAATFSVAVPLWAKSAATLLSLGAQRVHMGSCAEFGPLDVQLFTREREEWGSALDEVQSLDRITEAAITQADQAMLFLMGRTGKKMETLLPFALDFAAKLQAPMVEKIDTIHYTQQSRMLKVAEDYAVRLLNPLVGTDRAKDVANRLVNAYPEHGFVIDKDEASSMLPIDSDQVAEELLDSIGETLYVASTVLVGRVKEGDENGEDD